VAHVADVSGRIVRRALGRMLAAATAASLLAGTWAVATAGATKFTTSAAQAKVSQTQSRITQIEQTVAQEQHQSAVLGTRYDDEMAHVQAVRAAIAATDRRLAQVQSTIVVDRGVLAKAAVQDYVLGAQGTQITSLFSTSANTLVISEEYSDTAVGNLNVAKHTLETAQTALDATRAQQQVQERQAQTAAARLQTLQQENQQASVRSEATLQSLKGTLGKEVAAAEQAKAEREAAAAAAAARAEAAARAAAARATAIRAAAARAAAARAAAARVAAARVAAAQAAASAQQAAQEVSVLGGTTAVAEQAANQASSAAGGPTVGFSGTVSAAGQVAARAAVSQLGVPYVWGGETPGIGFDCSGLTQWSWSQAGVGIPRTSQEQYATVPHVPLSNLQPGDLLFYYNLDGTGTVDHVVMYVGSGPYGSQTVIQAPYTGSTVSYDALYTYGLVAAGQP
jgi:cell wall-associated NlpC family hydrolase